MSQTLTFTGFLAEMPEARHKNTRFVVEIENQQKALVTVPPYPRYSYGQKIEITGKPESAQWGENTSYAKYLESKGICVTFFMPKISELSGNGGNVFWKYLFTMKESFTSHLEKLFPEPQASFAAGLLLGDKKGLPENITRDFRRAGVSHIIALSGFNITILFAFIIFLLRNFSRGVQFAVSMTFMLWFVLITGASPSIVRAAIMGFLWFFARIVGRPGASIRALMISGAIMLIVNPRLLFYDPGFQLSFLATFGLIVFSKKIEKWFLWIKFKFIREPLTQTLAATFPTLPIIIFYFGQISFISPISNVIILPFIPIAMLLSGIPLFIDYFFPPFASLVAWWGNLILIAILKITEWFSNLPFAAWPS